MHTPYDLTLDAPDDDTQSGADMLDHDARFLDLMRFERNAIIRASAGTGKTYSLVSFIVHLLGGVGRDAVSPGRICAITFTEKAAAELKWRIRQRVSNLLLHPDRDPALSLTCAHMGIEPPGVEHWQRVHRDLGSMVVSTFHGFCAQMLRQFPVEAEVEPGFRMESELVGQSMLADVVEDVLIDRLSGADEGCLRLLDVLPLTSGEWRSGLSRLVSKSLRAMREDGLSIDAIVRRHGADHYASAIQAQVEALMAELEAQKFTLTELWQEVDIERLRRGSSVDRAFASELERYIRDVDTLEARLKEFDPDAAYAGRAPQIPRALDAETIPPILEFVDTITRYAAPISKGAAKAGRLTWDQKARLAPLPTLRDDVVASLLVGLAHQLRDDFLSIVHEVATVFAERKRAAGVLDFADLLLQARRLLRNNPYARRKLKQRFELMMVDEFQDTNRVQLDLVMLLGESLEAEAVLEEHDDVMEVLQPGLQRLFLVGDPKQSIYNFRGADVSVFRKVERRLVDELEVAKIHFLQHNRRSLPDLVAFGNRWFQDVLGEADASDPDFVVRFQPGDRMEAARDDGSDNPVVEYVALPERSKPEEEAQAIAGWIREYVSGQRKRSVYTPIGAGVSAAKEQPEFRDVAILLRRFTHLETFQRALELASVPYYVVKGKGFYGCTEISDLMLALRIMLRPDDSIALISALRSPLFMLSDNGLVWLQRQALSTARRALSASLVCEVAQDLPPTMTESDQHAVRAFASLYSRLAPNAGRLGPRRTMEALIAGTHFREKLAGSMRGQQRIGNVEKLLDIASSYERVGSGHLPGFVRTLEWLIAEEPREAEEQVIEESANAVRIMTIHQSKGLEFPVVVIPEVHIMRASPYHRDPIRYDRDRGFALDLRVSTAHGRRSIRTLDFETLKQTLTAREEAEERRLIYVATTRARDMVMLSGWGRALSDEGWRMPIQRDNHLTALQDLVVRNDPALSGRVAERTQRELNPWATAEADAADAPQAPQLEDEAWSEAVTRVLDTPPPPAQRPIIAIDDLVDFDRCPRRYFLWHVLGLDTSVREQTGAPSEATDAAYGRRGRPGRGEVAHGILARLDFAAWRDAKPKARRNLLRALLEAQDHRLPVPERDDVLRTVSEWLVRNPLVDTLIEAQERDALLREHPFLLRVPRPAGGEIVLRGHIDAVIQHEDGTLQLVEYLFGHAPRRGLGPYRFKLRCLALAAQSLWPDAPRDWHTSLAFLRDAETPAQDLKGRASKLDLFRHTLPEQLHLLLSNQRTQRWPRADATATPRTAARCRGEGCDYHRYCFPSAP